MKKEKQILKKFSMNVQSIYELPMHLVRDLSLQAKTLEDRRQREIISERKFFADIMGAKIS